MFAGWSGKGQNLKLEGDRAANPQVGEREGEGPGQRGRGGGGGGS